MRFESARTTEQAARRGERVDGRTWGRVRTGHRTWGRVQPGPRPLPLSVIPPSAWCWLGTRARTEAEPGGSAGRRCGYRSPRRHRLPGRGREHPRLFVPLTGQAERQLRVSSAFLRRRTNEGCVGSPASSQVNLLAVL